MKVNKRAIKDGIAFLASPSGAAQTKNVLNSIVDDAVALCRICNTAFQNEDPKCLVGILLPNTFNLFKEPAVAEEPAVAVTAEKPAVTEVPVAGSIREPSYYEAYAWRRR